MEFKSQICTTVEQSKRLLELGLKKDTADMVYHYTRSLITKYELRAYPPTLKHTTHLNVDKLNVFKHKKPDGSIMTGEEYFEELWGKDIPAWSLHRLMEILHKGDIHGVVTINVHNGNIESLYKLVIAKIEYLVKIKHFDIQYLEEQK